MKFLPTPSRAALFNSFVNTFRSTMSNKPETVSNTMGSLGVTDPRWGIVNGKSSSPHNEKMLDLDAIEGKRKISPSLIDDPEQKKHRTEGWWAVETDSAKEYKAKVLKKTGNNPKGQGFTYYTDADVLSGRGGRTNMHPGNCYYRDLILSHRRPDDIANKSRKPGVSRKIVQMVRDRGGHFFREEKDALYYDIGDEAARKKTSQALRHRTFEMKNKEDPRRIKEKRGRGKVHSEHAPLSSALLIEGAGLRGMNSSLCKSLDLSSSDRSDKLLELSHHGLQEHYYQEALAQQRQLHSVDSRHQDRAYLTALYALRQRRREAVLDLDKAIQDAQVRRHSSLSPGLPLSSGTPLMLGGRLLQSLGMPQHDQALLLCMADRRMVSSNSGMSTYLQASCSRRPSFLPEGPARNGY